RVRQRGLPPEEAPGGTGGALDAGVDHRLAQPPDHAPRPEPAAVAARAAGILAQAVLLHHERVADLARLDRPVVRIPVVDTDHRVHAVAVVLRAPAPAGVAGRREAEPPRARVD